MHPYKRIVITCTRMVNMIVFRTATNGSWNRSNWIAGVDPISQHNIDKAALGGGHSISMFVPADLSMLCVPARW
jgi:hypothetical protein